MEKRRQSTLVKGLTILQTPPLLRSTVATTTTIHASRTTCSRHSARQQPPNALCLRVGYGDLCQLCPQSLRELFRSGSQV